MLGQVARLAGPAMLFEMSELFWASCIANVAWLFLWHYNQLPITPIPMLLLLGCLIAIYLRLDARRGDAPTAERLAVRATFSVYLGWVTVATIANFTTVFYALGWRGQPLTEEFWAIALLVQAGLGDGAFSVGGLLARGRHEAVAAA